MLHISQMPPVKPDGRDQASSRLSSVRQRYPVSGTPPSSLRRIRARGCRGRLKRLQGHKEQSVPGRK